MKSAHTHNVTANDDDADDVDEDSRTNSATETMNNGLAARNPLLYNRGKMIKYIPKICEWEANFSTK